MGKKRVSMAVTKNQITELISKCKKMETDLKNWLNKPSQLLLHAGSAAASSGSGAATFGLALDTIVAVGIFCVFPQSAPVKSYLMSPQIRLRLARDMAVISGCDAGIECVMKGIRGEEDIESSMVAGFGAGVMYGLVTGEPARVVIGFGVLNALVKGGMFKVNEKPKFSW